ncbi:unnamed protein product [Meganyctiphanes norvegica]|uniref:Gustatory receptor n=1 Tax=Meganyctiphanes norvegica TaxID=48144 RepID=A0AAV2R5X6_MEGNR
MKKDKYSTSLIFIDSNPKSFRFFKLCGLFPIKYEDKSFLVDERSCVFSRLAWFVWHILGVALILWERITHLQICKRISEIEQINNDCKEDLAGLNQFLLCSFGICMFTLVDPLQTYILKRNIDFLPTVLFEMKKLEDMKLHLIRLIKSQHKETKIMIEDYLSCNEICIKKLNLQHIEGYPNNRQQSINKYLTSDEFHIKKQNSYNATIYNNNNQQSIDDSIPSNGIHILEEIPCHAARCKDNNKISIYYYNMILVMITVPIAVVFIGNFVYGFVIAMSLEDMSDEWKLLCCIIYLVFPVLTTWYCILFINFQRSMYQVVNDLDDDIYSKHEYIEVICNYFETMQSISRKLNNKTYKFIFGINFLLFIVFGTMSMYELFQGFAEIKDNGLFGDLIYIFPIAVCIFHIVISCQLSTILMEGQHNKLRYKLKRIMVHLLVGKEEKKFKIVELLYKNIKDFSPQPTVYGGIRVDYRLLTGAVIFIFTYSRIFFRHLGSNNSGKGP